MPDIKQQSNDFDPPATSRKEAIAVLRCVSRQISCTLRSIKDGRFLKQKAAMARCGCRAVLYLIEGEVDRARCPPASLSLTSCCHYSVLLCADRSRSRGALPRIRAACPCGSGRHH